MGVAREMKGGAVVVGSVLEGAVIEGSVGVASEAEGVARVSIRSVLV